MCGSGRIGGRRVRAADPGASGVPTDSVDGDRGADRVAVFDPDAEREGGGVAACVSAAGSGVADVVCGRGDRAVRLPVPADAGAGGVRAGPAGEAAAGADDGVRVFAVGLGPAGALAVRGGPVRRVMTADRGAGRGCRGRWCGTGKARSVGGAGAAAS